MSDTATKPRYVQLADSLRAAILRGDLSEDGQFPTETELCREHGVSRYTVREALRRLVAEGLIQRKRGSGTVIQPAAARGGTLHQPLSNVGELLQYARDTQYDFKPVGLTRLPRRIADHVSGETDGDWFQFQGIRTRLGDPKPIAITDAYVHGDYAEAAAEIRSSQVTIFRQLEELAGVRVAYVTQDIQAVGASADIAEALGISRRAPTLRILRAYRDAKNRIFEISASHHPGDRFAYSMHIDAES
ncbi:GntR family transcriptional regulator [Parasphingopyxis sp.]|uniref:GntR family transcriptional regulator n=1 Tax=Parasphingopyxis sp. TaxID=1920299 RepID=UPI002619BA13|nr:GntR family transcriptional regulator [Parasphingopyxis sp.]